MTTTEALNKMHGATASNTVPDGDMLSFGGWDVASVVVGLRSVVSCIGERNTFVADGFFTVRFVGDYMLVSAPHKP